MNAKKTLRSLLARHPELWTRGLWIRRRLNRALRRPFDQNFTALRSFLPKPGSVFLDIGANIGEAIDAMRIYHPKVPILGFEPQGSSFRELMLRCGAFHDVTLHEYALGEAAGSGVLYTPTYRRIGYGALASTIREEAADWIHRHAGALVDAAHLGLSEEHVEIRTLDSLNATPSFIKLDVQGAESLVLKGGWRTLTTHRPAIFVERGKDDDLSEQLAALGYRPYSFDGGALRLNDAAASSFFLHASHREAFTLAIE